MRSVKLSAVFRDFPFPYTPKSIPDLSISGISIDSRVVAFGELFVAMQGGSVDGHDYIPMAIDNGAVAVVGERNMDELSVPYIRVKNSRRSLTFLAAAFYDWPGRKLTVIGVTGTDGKTTTCNLLFHVLKEAGLRVGMISTVNAVIGDEVLDTGFHVTTPDAHDVQRYLAKMVDSGLTHVVLETTSHGWSQYRVDACEFDIGVVTNITHEHFDMHGSYETYRAAKARLFDSLEWTGKKPQGNPRLAIFNHDDRSFDFLDKYVKVNKLTYGLTPESDVQGYEIRYKPGGMEFSVKHSEFRVTTCINLVGAYNVSNCLAAMSAAIFGLGIDPDVAARGVEKLPGIPGRMERIDMGQNLTAVVDFAHTPNALKVTLETARQMTEGRVIVVFGSAGLRDKEKRRMMAEVSAELADFTVLTAEDPRTESLDGILGEMAAGASSKGRSEGETFWRISDRGEAIKFALRLAHPGDIVLSCGKGHEQSMCFGRVEHPWDDRIAMRAALADYLDVDGPEMPYLPTQDTSEEDWLQA
jgi:UDP-N-acetylmuramoyl-L-alanyl-D-glutamate--2,6-diaminopimelate ligase